MEFDEYNFEENLREIIFESSDVRFTCMEIYVFEVRVSNLQ